LELSFGLRMPGQPPFVLGSSVRGELGKGATGAIAFRSPNSSDLARGPRKLTVGAVVDFNGVWQSMGLGVGE